MLHEEDETIKIQKTKATMIAAVTAVLLTALTSGLLASTLSSQTVPGNGTVASINVGVYTDLACTNNCTSIDWSIIAPGGSANRIVYIKNTGTVPMTLSLSNSSWTPTGVNNYMTLTWDKEGYQLAAGNITTATLTLQVSETITDVTTFSFNIIITGTQES